MLSEPFLNIEPDDSRFKNVKVILITANCSKSGVANAVDFIVNEGEDMKILKDLSVGETDTTKLGELSIQHNEQLKHAMKCKKEISPLNYDTLIYIMLTIILDFPRFAIIFYY